MFLYGVTTPIRIFLTKNKKNYMELNGKPLSDSEIFYRDGLKVSKQRETYCT